MYYLKLTGLGWSSKNDIDLNIQVKMTNNVLTMPSKMCLWLLVCSLPSLDADCTYPVQWTTSTFYDNAKGPVTFSGNTMEGWPVTLTTIQKTVSSWECYHRNESTIVSKYGLKLPSNNPCFYVNFFIAGNHL